MQQHGLSPRHPARPRPQCGTRHTAHCGPHRLWALTPRLRRLVWGLVRTRTDSTGMNEQHEAWIPSPGRYKAGLRRVWEERNSHSLSTQHFHAIWSSQWASKLGSIKSTLRDRKTEGINSVRLSLGCRARPSPSDSSPLSCNLHPQSTLHSNFLSFY